MARSQFPVARPRKTAAKKTKALKRLQTHVFLNGGQTNYALVPICEGCGQLRTHRVHDLYQIVDEEATALDERKGG